MPKLSTLVDNFNDNSLDTVLWSTSGTVTETGGQAVLTPQVGSSVLNGDSTGYDLTDSYIIAHIPTVTGNGTIPAPSGDLQSAMVVRWDANNRLLIRKLKANWVVTKIVAAVITDIFTTTYNSTNHRWWRIREGFDTGANARLVYFDACSDGVHWTNYFSIVTPFQVTDVTAYFSAGWSSGVESSPGTMRVETVNPILLTDVAGNPAPAFVDSSSTNSTATIYQISASGSSTTTGSGTITIIAAGSTAKIRDIAGNLAPAFTDSPSDNQTPSNFQSISATGQTTISGSALVVGILAISGMGGSGRTLPYDSDLLYDGIVLYDPNFTAGSASLTTLAPGATNFITSTGTTTTSGSAAITAVPPGGLSGVGLTTTSGSASLTIPIVNISATGITTIAGSATFLLSNLLASTGTTLFHGLAALDILTPLFMFEPPIAYDLPPTLPDPKPRYLNAHAKWKPGQRRGRTVLKENGQYVIVDSPTVDRTLAAEKVYMGGHVHVIDQNEAYALTAAGFTVTAFVR